MEIEIVTFEAKCSDCGEIFDHPSLGDFAYGEFIFTGTNGKVFAYCSAFDATSKLIQVLLPEKCSPEVYQAALAELADPIQGQKLTLSLRCPKCRSTSLAYWEGQKTGTLWVKPVTYHNLLSLKRDELIKKVQDFAREKNA